jgi:hypothetical protein
MRWKFIVITAAIFNGHGEGPRIEARRPHGHLNALSQLGVGDLHGISAGKIRLQFLAQCLHALGHKPLFHFLEEGRARRTLARASLSGLDRRGQNGVYLTGADYPLGTREPA